MYIEMKKKTQRKRITQHKNKSLRSQTNRSKKRNIFFINRLSNRYGDKSIIKGGGYYEQIKNVATAKAAEKATAEKAAAEKEALEAASQAVEEEKKEKII
jgi:hypothetical protein